MWARHSRSLLNSSIGMLTPTSIPLSVFPFVALVDRLFENSLRDTQDRQYYVELVKVPDFYDGPRLQFPLTFTDIDLLLEAFRQQQVSLSRSCSDSCIYQMLNDCLLNE
jgi:uncharacterized protein (DUF2236 family)